MVDLAPAWPFGIELAISAIASNFELQVKFERVGFLRRFAIEIIEIAIEAAPIR